MNQKEVSLPQTLKEPLKTKKEDPTNSSRIITHSSLSGYDMSADISTKGGFWIKVRVLNGNSGDYFNGSYSVKENRWIGEKGTNL